MCWEPALQVARILILPISMTSRQSAQTPMSYPDRKSTRLNSSHLGISYAVFCLKKKDIFKLTASRLHTLSGLLLSRLPRSSDVRCPGVAEVSACWDLSAFAMESSIFFF